MNTCKTCGKEFKPRHDNKGAKYCCRKCYLSDPEAGFLKGFEAGRKKAPLKLKEKWQDPEFRASQSQKISAATKAAMADLEIRARYEASLTEERAKKIGDKKREFYQVPENRQELSERTKQFYLDHPEYKDAQSLRTKEFFSDPENAKKHSEKLKETYSDPQKRAEICRRNAEYYSVLEHRMQHRSYTVDQIKGFLSDVFLELVNPDEDVVTATKTEVRCTRCGKEFTKILRCVIYSDQPGHCPICDRNISKHEVSLAKWLEGMGIRVDLNRRDLISPLEIDLYLPEFNLAIEVNGLYFHSEVAGRRSRSYHKLKSQMADAAGLKLLQFWDIEIMDKRDLVESMILARLGKLPKVYARKYVVTEVPNSDAKNFYEENHIQGSVDSPLHYSLGDVAMMSFKRWGDGWEISRFASKKGVIVVGGFDKILARFLEEHPDVEVRSFMDLRFSKRDQNVYLKTGFELMGETDPNYFYTKDYRSLESRLKYQKHKLSNLLAEFDPEKSESENMFSNGYDRIWDCGSCAFVRRVSK